MENQKDTENSETIEDFIPEWESEKPKKFSPEQLQDFTSNFSKKLGYGSFGDVYQGIYNEKQVAVKRLKQKVLADNIKDQFIAEVSTLGKVHHRNLVKLYGFCFQPKMKALVYEYMEMGSLDKVIKGKQSIKWETLCNIAIGAAKGLTYLHEDCQPSIIHYDIKPSNILLDSNYSPKIGDFGLAKLLIDVTHVSTKTHFRGTPNYWAPEIYTPHRTVNYKCDVYSYGMMLFDIVSMGKYQHKPGEEWYEKTFWDKYKKGELEEVIADCIEEKDKDMAERILMIALNCVEFSASNRPSMSDVVRFLEGTKDPPLPPNRLLSSPPQAPPSIVVPNNRNLERESGVVDKMINSHDEKEKEREGDIIVEIRYKSIGPWGGSGGDEWDDGFFPGILQIEIVSARREICSIEIEYCGNDGTSVGWSNKHGHNPGQQTDNIVFDYPSEYLMGITGFMHVSRNANIAVRSLSFITNKKIHGPYGVNLIVKGDPFTSGKLGKVVGFHGRSGAWLDAIGVHMEADDPNI